MWFVSRNGKIDSTPLRVRELVIFNKERYERIKGIVKGKCKRIVRERVNKKLSAKIEKVVPVAERHINSPYEPSNIIYTRRIDLWGWRHVNEWFKELKDYEVCAKKYLIKE